MKAEDTVMNKEQLFEVQKKWFNEFSFEQLYENFPHSRIAEAQAEISFKAGIKLVVNWIEGNVNWRHDAPYKSTIDMHDWRAFFKEVLKPLLEQ